MTNTALVEEALTHSVIGAFFKVYNALGYGFLEHLYVMALERELMRRGHTIQRELWVSIYYDGDEIGKQRLDMVVDGKLIVECKATDKLAPSAPRQLLNYLRASDIDVGLLLHFGPDRPEFRRLVYQSAKLRPSAPFGDRPSVLSASPPRAERLRAAPRDPDRASS